MVRLQPWSLGECGVSIIAIAPRATLTRSGSSSMKRIKCAKIWLVLICDLRAILNKSWRQHPTRHQLYGHLPPITKTIQVRRARHAGHCRRSKDELVSDVLLWTPTYGQAKAGRPARTYIQQVCEDTGCNPEDLLEAMNDREKWREMVRDIHASGTTWWWWWYCNIWKHSIVSKKELRHFRMLSTKCVYKLYVHLLYMYKEDFTLNNIQWLIYHKPQPNWTLFS